MGMRLHVATKYQIEYSDIEFFNWKQLEFADLLEAVGICVDPCEDTSRFDFDKEDMEMLIREVLTSDNDKVLKAVEAMGESRENIAGKLQQLLDAAEPNNNYIHLRFL